MTDELQTRCDATLPDPAGSGLRMRCERDAGHPLIETYVDSGTPADWSHRGTNALGGGVLWWDSAEGAHPHGMILEPRLFALIRHDDPSGVSGTGRVAWGVQWPDGTVEVRWISDWPTTAHHALGMGSVEHIHLHGGATEVQWL